MDKKKRPIPADQVPGDKFKPDQLEKFYFSDPKNLLKNYLHNIGAVKKPAKVHHIRELDGSFYVGNKPKKPSSLERENKVTHSIVTYGSKNPVMGPSSKLRSRPTSEEKHAKINSRAKASIKR